MFWGFSLYYIETVDRHERARETGMTRSKGQQVGFEPKPLKDSANMGRALLLGELEAAPSALISLAARYSLCNMQ